MKRYLSFIALVSMVLSYSCSKSSGGGGGTTPVTFQPKTTGSTWNYTLHDNGTGSNTTYTLTATANDTTVGGLTYKIFTNSSGPNEYYNQTSYDYHQFQSLGTTGVNLDFLYLKDQVAAGTTWTTNSTASITVPGIPTPVPINIKLDFKIEEKLNSYTVAGIPYNDVVKVSTVPTITTTIPGVTINTTSNIYYYYGRGVGRLYNAFDLTIAVPLASFYQSVSTTTTLNTYHIN